MSAVLSAASCTASSAECAALYVHIPFCKSKCSYCDFFSVVCGAHIDDAYIESLLREAQRRCTQFGIERWRTIYIGGGTPSLLTTTQLTNLMTGLLRICPLEAGAECTIECNPDDITESLVKAAADCGITRLSLGIQAMDDAPLVLMARRCRRSTNLRALECINSFWDAKNHFSVDLIAGLPSHSYESFCSGVREVLSSRVDHVSLYSLMIEEHTPLFRAVEDGTVCIDEDCADTYWLKGREIIEHAGLAQYEVSNFARAGYESAHNLVYWNMEPYVGIGAGATGTVGTYRYTNTTDFAQWFAEKPDTPEILSVSVQQFEFVMMGFRKRSGICTVEFFRRFGTPFAESACGAVFERWKQKGLAVSADGRCFLTAEGLLFLNRFLSEVADVSVI